MRQPWEEAGWGGRHLRGWGLALALAVLGGLLGAPGTALAQGNGYSVTFVARWCPSYSDVYANFGRSNLMESLQDLGPDSPYGPDSFTNFPMVLPSVEDAGAQALAPPYGNGVCHPLPGWAFTLGRGKVPRPAVGTGLPPGEPLPPWGALSSLTDNPALPDWTPPSGCPPEGAYTGDPACQPPFDPLDPAMRSSPTPFPAPIVTQTSVPLLDEYGNPVPGESIPGAVTVPLTPEQEQAAFDPNIGCGGYEYYTLPAYVCEGGLWAQGGTPDDPVNAATFGGMATPTYAYAALRCAFNNADGDNADIITFGGEDDVKHVFCYAYYVKPPPPAGAITITKVIKDAPEDTTPGFQFDGTINFGTSPFPLPTTGIHPQLSQTFFRAAGRVWTVAEDTAAAADAGYHLSSLTCNALNTPGHSTASISGSTAAIDLAAGEHVTCTFENTYGPPPPGALRITKIATGGVGTFRYVVTGNGGRHRVTATTFVSGIPVDAVPSLTDLSGTYRIREVMPSSPDGRWRLTSVVCGAGVRKPTTGPVTVTIDPQATTGTVCTFTNKFIPRGSISIGKITRGATGRAAFLVSGPQGPPNNVGIPQLERRLSVTTKTEGVEAAATPDTPGLDQLRLGHYRILEEGPAGDGWSLTGVTCNGVQEPFAQGAIEVTLTRSQPHPHCVFTNTFTKHPPPAPKPDPPAPLPPPAPPGPDPLQPAQQSADLAVTKRASTPVAHIGDTVTFRITVRNHGPDHASRVVLHDQLFGAARLVAIHTDAGRCSARLPVACQLGTLRPGAAAHVTIRLRITARSRFSDRAVVGTATADPRLANNVDSATVRLVRRPAPPPPTVTG